jgi:EAL domain-containing protein (putative c-di-GMP-specific phosphodiesterase class I)/GGDEF domain-containing protein
MIHVTRKRITAPDGSILGISGVITNPVYGGDRVLASMLVDVDTWTALNVKMNAGGGFSLPETADVGAIQRHLIDFIASDDAARAFIAALSPAYVHELHQSKKSEITCGCGAEMRIEARVYEIPYSKRLMMALVLLTDKDSDMRTGPNGNDYRLDVPIRHPIRLGGIFVARLADGLPIARSSASFDAMLGTGKGKDWIHPGDAAILLARSKAANAELPAFFARLQAESGETILARLECRVSPDRNFLLGAAYNISDKLAAERSIDKLRTAIAIIERLTRTEFDLVSLIDARTGELTVVSLAHAAQCASTGDRLSYPTEYEDYLRESIILPEVEDCVRHMSLDAVKTSLAQNDRYELSYSMHEGDEIRRKKWVFSYLDSDRDVIVHMRSDVTDTYMMQFDPVSGLYNRHQFQRLARNLLDENRDRRFLFVRFDIENFRAFNDLYGVAAGNRLIASIKDLFVTFHTNLSVCGHIEAEHFACVTSEEEYNIMPNIGRILKWLKSHNPDFDFSPKIGVYPIDDPSLDIVSMSNRALLALNSIKGKYGAHLARYSEEMREKMLEEQSIANDMARALEDNEFEPYLQPQYNYLTETMTGAELLLRWNHPKKGLLTPKDFIPIFEKNGFITQIDKRVWAMACELQRRWLDMGLPVVPLSVNVSRADINDPDLYRTIGQLVDFNRLEPKHIRLEITETAYMQSPEQLIDAVKKLRAMGFMVEMDDFGSGYSSLNMLRDVEVDVLKLDMAFLRGSGSTPRGDSILHSVIRMARLLKIPVIAEGVETAEQAEYLSRAGCRLMQGYYFARPMCSADFEELLKQMLIMSKDLDKKFSMGYSLFKPVMRSSMTHTRFKENRRR